LDLPNMPAVILVEAVAFSNGAMGGGGGRMHLPVAQYYDVPVINQRHPLVNHFARYPQLIRPYFSQDYWGSPDTRHMNAKGHRDLGNLIASFLKDTTCDLISHPDFLVPSSLGTPNTLPLTGDLIPSLDYLDQSQTLELPPLEAAELEDTLLAVEQQTWPVDSRTWRKDPPPPKEEGSEPLPGELMPGLWTSPPEYPILPRLPFLSGWNPDITHTTPPFHPTCLSTRSESPAYQLTPTFSDGWYTWTHPEHLDKPYLLANSTGARVEFELETNVGVVKMYSLRSSSFGLGTVECWVDEDRENGVKVVGWWDKWDLNIGRFSTIATDLPPGVHKISCEVLEETSDPGGGHEFRMISIMSV